MNMVYIVLWVLILLGRSAGGKSNSWVPDVHYWRYISYQIFFQNDFFLFIKIVSRHWDSIFANFYEHKQLHFTLG